MTQEKNLKPYHLPEYSHSIKSELDSMFGKLPDKQHRAVAVSLILSLMVDKSDILPQDGAALTNELHMLCETEPDQARVAMEMASDGSSQRLHSYSSALSDSSERMTLLREWTDKMVITDNLHEEDAYAFIGNVADALQLAIVLENMSKTMI